MNTTDTPASSIPRWQITGLPAVGPLGRIAARLGRLWWLLLVVGSAWIVLGFVALRLDHSTPVVIGVTFGIILLFATVGEVVRAVVTTGGWRAWHVVVAVLLLVGAVTAFVDPAGSFVTLVTITGFYFVLMGTFDIVSSLFAAGVIAGWWLQLISGILEVVLGFIAAASFENSAIILVTWFSLTAVFRGVAEIAAAFSVRSLAPRT